MPEIRYVNFGFGDMALVAAFVLAAVLAFAWLFILPVVGLLYLCGFLN